MDEKRCPKCGETKPATLDYFYASKQTVSGLFGWCKECSKAQSLNSHYADRAANNAKKKAAYAAKHPGYQPMVRRTPEERLERRRAQAREWKARNRERVREYNRDWVSRNMDSMCAHASKRRARRRGSGGWHTGSDVRAQYQRQRGKCYWCGDAVGNTYHADHVVPLTKGGSDGPENIVVSCPHCNQVKHSQHPMDFGGRLF